MKIDVGYVRRLREELDFINKLNLQQIEWYENGQKVEIDPKVLEEFKFVGLSNENFITMEFYKGNVNICENCGSNHKTEECHWNGLLNA